MNGLQIFWVWILVALLIAFLVFFMGDSDDEDDDNNLSISDKAVYN